MGCLAHSCHSHYRTLVVDTVSVQNWFHIEMCLWISIQKQPRWTMDWSCMLKWENGCALGYNVYLQGYFQRREGKLTFFMVLCSRLSVSANGIKLKPLFKNNYLFKTVWKFPGKITYLGINFPWKVGGKHKGENEVLLKIHPLLWKS